MSGPRDAGSAAGGVAGVAGVAGAAGSGVAGARRAGEAGGPEGPEGPGRSRRRGDAERHLEAFGRYAEILDAQLLALDGKAPDLERFNALSKERAALAREIDATPRPLPDAPELKDLIARIRDRVQGCRETDLAVIRRLGELRDETTRALDGLEKGRPARSGYLGGAASKGGVKLDVKL